MSLFTRKVRISLDTTEALFAHESRSCRVEPVLYIDPAQPDRLLSVGDPPEQSDARRVALFDGQPCEHDKGLLLEAFLRFALHRLLGRTFRSTAVEFDLSPEVASCLGGFHRYVLDAAGRRGGAVSVSYVTRE